MTLRLLLSTCCTFVVSLAASAQTADDIRNYMYANCMSQGYGPAFCACWVHASLGLLTPEDTQALLRGYTTPHIPLVDQQANAACARYLR